MKMSKSAEAGINDEAKKLKQNLDGWREVLLPANSLLLWRRPADPGIIGGIVSVLFASLWYFDPTLLTTLSMLGLVAVVADFLIHTVAPQFAKPDNWTPSKERDFEGLCRKIAVVKITVTDVVTNFVSMRKARSMLFYLVTAAVLLFFSWLGNAVNNLLLTYFLVTGILMSPGIAEKGFLSPYLHKLTDILSPIFCSKESLKKEE